MRILLADDHEIVRSGLRRILADAFPGSVIGEVGSCKALQDKVREASWSVLVLDIAIAERNSLDIVPELRELQPNMPIIILSMYGERQFVVRALQVGVSAYLTKDRAPEDLLQAVRSVLQGKRYLCETVAAELAGHVALGASGTEAPHTLLSSREYEVFLLLASGRTVSEVAAQLRLSVKTVSTHRARILEKMGMSSNAQLMRYAMRHSLVQ